MTAHDPWGSGDAPHKVMMERASAEILRRIALRAKSDPNFGRPVNDASLILASRRYSGTVQPTERPVDDAAAILAQRVFGAASAGAAAGTPTNVPWTLVQRDGTGHSAHGRLELEALQATATGAASDLVLYAPDGVTEILRVPTATRDIELPNGSLKVQTGFSCNGKAPQLAVPVGAAVSPAPVGGTSVGGSAANPYDAPTQDLINNLAAAVNADAAAIGSLASDLFALASLVATMRAALVGNGTLV